jgi:hypothetical protein
MDPGGHYLILSVPLIPAYLKITTHPFSHLRRSTTLQASLYAAWIPDTGLGGDNDADHAGACGI